MWVSGKDESKSLRILAKELEGELLTSLPDRLMYATDASAYREIPLAVALPHCEQDISRLIAFASRNKVTLIPRAAGTSLAGQVVGNGIVVDVSPHFNRVLEINTTERWVNVQPGVVLDELNRMLAAEGLFFGPETSTSNRCMIGGMIGNNACGAHSLIYGSTRDHLLEVSGFLSSGEYVTFGPLDPEAFYVQRSQPGLLGKIYTHIHQLLSDPAVVGEITAGFPHPGIHRRNTGYALDLLAGMKPFAEGGKPYNFSTLIAGSEGTLMFVTSARLNLLPLPPRVKGLVCVHLSTLEEALEANLVCLKHKPGAVELMDKAILDCTRANIEQRKNRFFLQEDPGAILIVEFACETEAELAARYELLVRDLKGAGFGFHYPLVTGSDINRVWALRKSGLGVLSNLPGDAKPVSLVEDTAVLPEQLPAFISDFREILDQHRLSCVFHAHVGTGELHLRPVLNLKRDEGVRLFRTVATEVAHLVKKYRGSLSGEHGDGRLRGEFISIVVGRENHLRMEQLKQVWDPAGVFNLGKITATPPMDAKLRYRESAAADKFSSVFRYLGSNGGMLAHAEQCNGSGDCRKPHSMGGTMCPSYMATRNEYTTTRARANILREYLQDQNGHPALTPGEVYDVLDLCLACKGCKSECPSNVDMAKLKAEFLQHYHDVNGLPVSAWLVANLPRIHRLNARFPWLFNALVGNPAVAAVIRGVTGFDRKRRIPLLSATGFTRWLKNNGLVCSRPPVEEAGVKRICLFVDEFTDHLEAEMGIMAVRLFRKLGYRVFVLPGIESGRTYLSKGLLRKARRIANQNVETFASLADQGIPLVGIEPSAILTFRDEYPEIVNSDLLSRARALSSLCFMAEEFLANEFVGGRIDRSLFTTRPARILYHGHCQQKAIASTQPALTAMSIPINYEVEEIRSGCCGMAGSFGYEKRHYNLSMKIGEMVLFPAVRQADAETIISASGTSCRQQIADGTERQALHPLQVLFYALA